MKKETIGNIVKASEIKAGDLVVLQYWGYDLSNKVVTDFCSELAKVGATPLILQQEKGRNQKIMEVAKEECFNDKYFKILEGADVVIDLIYNKIGLLEAPLEEHQMQIAGRYMGRLFQTLQTRPKFLQVRIPSSDNAIVAGLDEEEYIFRMNRAYDIDYDMLKLQCKKKVEELIQADRIAIVTGKEQEHELTFSILDREWKMDVGDGDLPCGEVYIAPIEYKTIGTVYFETLYLEQDKYDEVVLEISSGKIITSNVEELNLFLNSLTDCDKMVCELGFGMNPNVESLCGYPLLDEKMIGTFHIAIGDNTMFGGENEANVHMDMVGNGKYII